MEGYVHGHRSKGRPKRRWIDGLKEDYALQNLTIRQPGSTMQDRRSWRGARCVLLYCLCTRQTNIDSAPRKTKAN